MRLGEPEHLTWGDVDEPRSRWRISQAVSKNRAGRWVNVPPAIFEAVTALVPRDTALRSGPSSRVSAATPSAPRSPAPHRRGHPVFSPHDLRHRRISLMHLGGAPWARIGQHVGQRSLFVTANTYTHVVADGRELDYAGLLSSGT
jgi:integrase